MDYPWKPVWRDGRERAGVGRVWVAGEVEERWRGGGGAGGGGRVLHGDHRPKP